MLSDAFKLIHIARTLDITPRLILCLSDPVAARHFTTSRTWAADALRAFGVGIEIVVLPADVNAAVLTAQRRQYR